MKQGLQINEGPLTYMLRQTETEVQFKLGGNYKPFAQYFCESKVREWLSEESKSTYAISINELQWKFNSLLVFSDVDHSPLIRNLKSQLSSHVLLEVKYPLQEYGKIVKRQLKSIQPHICAEQSKQLAQRGQGTVLLLVRLAQKETILAKLANLKQFNCQNLIYPIEEYLTKMKLPFEEHGEFINGVVHHYEQTLKRFFAVKLKQIGLEDEVLIKRIRKDQQFVRNCKYRTGLLIECVGFERTFGKIYQLFERWLQKLSWVVAEVQRVQCCKKEVLVQWFNQKHQHKAYLLSARSGVERVVFFSPKKQRLHFQRLLRLATRIVTGREIQNFSVIYKYKIEFRKFIAGQKIGESNLKIFQNFTIYQGDPNVEQKFIRKTKEFLQQYNEQHVQITNFKSDFHRALLRNFYGRMIKTKPTTLQLIDNKLYRINPKKLSECADNELKELFQRMCKELVFKPLARPLPKKVDYFDVKPAPAQWKVPQCVESRKYRIGDKVAINLKSYGTISNGKSSCVFFVSDFDKCEELHQILQIQGGLSVHFKQNLIKNMSLTMPLRFSKYFDKIYICYLRAQRGKPRLQSRAVQSKLKAFIEGIIDDNNNSKEINFMFPKEFQLADLILHMFFHNLMQSLKFKPEMKKEVTLYTSCFDGDRLRKNIIEFLKTFRFQADFKVDRISDLDLKIPQMQKIIEFKYYDLKFYQNGVNKTATAMNSFIFQKQYKKQTKTPIFLYSQQELAKSNYCEYLVNCFDWQVHEIQKDQNIKLKQKCQKYEGLYRLCSAVKKYFAYVDCLLVCGDIRKDEFSYKFAYTDNSQRLYKRFEQVTIDPKHQKLLVKENTRLAQFQLVPNKYLELYRVEAHPDKLEELRELKKCTALE